MSLIQVTPKNAEFKEVFFLGGHLEIPANHNWVALSTITNPNGAPKTMITSYENKPSLSRKGNYIADGDYRFVVEVESVETVAGTLRHVDGVSDTKEVLLLNSEELAYKITAVLNAADLSQDEKIEELFSAEGVFAEFSAYQNPCIDSLRAEEAEAQMEACAPKDPEPRCGQAEGPGPQTTAAAKEVGIPAELAELLYAIASVAKAK